MELQVTANFFAPTTFPKLLSVPEMPQELAFAVWCPGRHVLCWGVEGHGTAPASLVVRQVVGNFGAFAAILMDGRVATWGLPECGGHLELIFAKICQTADN